MAPRISVLLPVFNGQRYIRKAIDSVLSQTFRSFELLIVDDGSTDATGDIVVSYDDLRIRLIRNERRLKLSGALNRGLRLARGEYVARMDADDVCMPNRLAVQASFLDAHPQLGICGSHTRVFGMKKWEVHRAPLGREHVKAHMLFDNPFVHPAVMLRKSFFDRHGLRYNGDYYPTEDYELWSRALHFFPGDNIGRVLLKYRLHKASMTRSDWTNMDQKATRVVGRIFREADITLTEDELGFHRTIGRETSFTFENPDDICRGENWLLHLGAINQKKRFVAPFALADITAEVWFRLCFNSSGLGAWIVRKYMVSKLVAGRRHRFYRAFMILLSFLKRHTLQPRSNPSS